MIGYEGGGEMECTVIILAGGQSRRMGTNKALLPVEGETVISRIVKEARRLDGEILLVTNQPKEYEFLHLPHAGDLREGMGPLAGLEAGLLVSKTEKNLLLACDVPFFQAGIGKRLLHYLDHYELAVPVAEGRRHPLCAAYRKSLLPTIQKTLDAGQRRMDSLLDTAKVKLVKGENPHYFFNMNTKEDYQRIKAIHKGEGHEISSD